MDILCKIKENIKHDTRMLELKQLSKKYSKKIALDDVTYNFLPSKVYGVVGENGAGKTTLFKCIAGMESYEGSIISPYENIKNHIGYLDTNPVFLSYITGWEYLKLLCTAKHIATENFEEQNLFNLPLNQYAETYSTGMKKKLALMGVLLRKNEIVILDEPFNGVDIQSNIIIAELVKELKALHKTVLISSHIFSTLSESCDEILLLSKGKVIKNVEKDDYAALEKSMKQDVMDSRTKKIILE